jgi:starch phosphorylase
MSGQGILDERQIQHYSERDMRLELDSASIARDVVKKLFLELAKFPGVATRNDHYLALAYAIRDRLLQGWVRSAREYLFGRHRTVIYLSAEYLIGPQLGAHLLNLHIEEAARAALAQLGLSLDELLEQEEEPGLGNGGLGRLAACYMESLASECIPAIGHGLHYEFGIFDQEIRDGMQVERTDRWLRYGYPWEVRRHDIEVTVGFGGRTERIPDGRGGFRVQWYPDRTIVGVPSDTPVPGHGVANTNFLRLWTAMAAEEFDLDAFQAGEYWRAVDAKIRSETVTKVLYPNDQSPAGKQLRLEQQAFFVSCVLQDCLRLLLQVGTIEEFADLYAIQLNDTHPALAVAELMRLLVDVHHLPWEQAWDITRRSISFTNHTLMPEALESWPVPLLARLLPRHLEIIYEINRRFLEEVRRRFPGDEARVRRMSIINEEGERSVRMIHLATVASFRVNGVAALHSRLVRETLLSDFDEMYPGRIVNVTNGVSLPRFVALANPNLTELLDQVIQGDWLREPERLQQLESLAEHTSFRERWREVKLSNKRALAKWLMRKHALLVDPDTLFDAQCKRIHEYKRQLLNLLHVIALWNRIEQGRTQGLVPRTFIFAGKAAPGYATAKLIITLIHGVARVIEADKRARELIRVVFVPDFSVRVAQRIYPAADLSEQLSTAGTEASGTGNMKFTLNGALTLGTLDGANIDIQEAVGAENFFAFGLDAVQVRALRRAGYAPAAVLQGDPELAFALDRIAEGAFSQGRRDVFEPLVRTLVQSDPFLVLADFRAYADAQLRVAEAWQDRERWSRSSIACVARSSYFSSDRAVREYARHIWNVEPVMVATAPERRNPVPLGARPSAGI